MFKRIFISTVILFLLAASSWTPGAAYAQTAQTGQTTAAQPNNEVTNLILSGLWQGINFNFAPATISPPTNTLNHTHNPAPTPATSGAYIAMGDSVAAGVGLATPADVPASAARCGRTTEAYPYAVAAATGLPLVHTACSGATTRDFYTRDWVPSPSQPAQLSTAFAGGTPRLVTITSGANDIRWIGFLDNCYRLNCATEASTAALSGSLKLLDARLGSVLSQIRSRSNTTPPTVIITGYYDPVSTACNGVVPSITPAEITWISNAVQSLNQTIQNAAARYPFARFAPVDFTGHDLCSQDSWIQGLQSPRPFHPTAAGQQAMAQSVITAYGR